MFGGNLMHSLDVDPWMSLAASLVVFADPLARNSSSIYRERAQPWLDELVTAVHDLPPGRLREACETLLAGPGSPQAFRALARFGAEAGERAGAEGGCTDKVLELAVRADSRSRITCELGDLYDPDSPSVTLEHLIDLQLIDGQRRWTPRSCGAGVAELLVVIPFRARPGATERVRNLAACLLALADQSLHRDRYRVLVVESDSCPRWTDLVAALADEHLFAPGHGPFNKSWAVNVGVVADTAGSPFVCILDADVLCDREFLERNLMRLRRIGVGGLLPYRDLLCLDPGSTSRAIADRCVRGSAVIDPSPLRRFALRRPPGACVFVRSDVYRSIGGMDERYVGWGGEDDDFRYRFDHAAPMDSYDDPLWHMHHPASSPLVDGMIANMERIPPLSWVADAPFGQLTGPRARP